MARNGISRKAATKLKTGSYPRLSTARPQHEKQDFIVSQRVENIPPNLLLRRAFQDLWRMDPKAYYAYKARYGE